MAKLEQDRDTKRRDGVQFGFVAGEQIFCGAMVAMNASGKLVAATTSGKNAVGIAEEAGAAGELVRVRRGTFNFVNDSDALTLADIGSHFRKTGNRQARSHASGNGSAGHNKTGTVLSAG